MKKQAGKTLAIWGIFTGWLIPLLGLILGVLALSEAKSPNVKTLATASIAEAIAFWLLWVFLIW
jgi:hypothetical protein